MNKERLAKLAGIELTESTTHGHRHKSWIDNDAKNIENNIDSMYWGPSFDDSGWGPRIREIWDEFKYIFSVDDPEQLPTFTLSKIMVKALSDAEATEEEMEDYCDELERAFLDHAEHVYGIRRDY